MSTVGHASPRLQGKVFQLYIYLSSFWENHNLRTRLAFLRIG